MTYILLLVGYELDSIASLAEVEVRFVYTLHFQDPTL